MKYLGLTLDTPEANLACDEALLDQCEQEPGEEVLRVWEARSYFVVLGYGNRVGREVTVERCRQTEVPILRRCSGGGAVLQGPGSFNYSLVLRFEPGSPISTIVGTNRHIMEKQCNVFRQLLKTDIQIRGHTDLAQGDRKFSGNAQRRRSHCVLFHGSILLHLDLGRVEELLPPPSKQPQYRGGRTHRDFLMNLGVPATNVAEALKSAWQASEPTVSIPQPAIDQLIKTKYSQDQWNLRA
jgi:lipoate-protein ligase A